MVLRVLAIVHGEIAVAVGLTKLDLRCRGLDRGGNCGGLEHGLGRTGCEGFPMAHPAVFVVGPVASAAACAGLSVASSSVLPMWTVTSGRTRRRWQAGQDGGQCRS